MLSNKILYNSRYQHPVGQGFFHTGQISFGGKTLHYVYDCGSEDICSLSTCIRGYLSNLNGQRKIDVLFLSHLHKDHVNGLDLLLGGISVDTVIIPYLSPIERLAFLASSLNEQPLSASFIQLISNPTQWFETHGVKDVLHVKKGNDSIPKFRKKIDSKIDIPSESLKIDFNSIESPEDSQNPSKTIKTISDSDPLYIKANRAFLNWTFLTYVCPEDKQHINKFEKLVKKEFGDIPHENERLVDIVQNLRERKKLYSCYYSTWSGNLNATSLSMYSGPFKITANFRISNQCQPDLNIVPNNLNSDRCAWLGTGDSDLRTNKRRSEFLKHFKSVSKLVHSLALPHHGSKGNFHQKLLDIGSPVCVVSAGNRYKHPSKEVVQAVLNENRHLVIVSNDINSMWCEKVALSWK
ncbi:MAG: hypothetical protein ABR969_08490 [Sedimentisphaerales bacterium]|jgi:hypothetical protein